MSAAAPGHASSKQAFMVAIEQGQHDSDKTTKQSTANNDNEKNTKIQKQNKNASDSSQDKRSEPLRYATQDLLFGSVMFIGGEMVLGCFDTMSQCGIWDASSIPDDAVVLCKDDGTRVEGLGGKITEAGTLYQISVSMRVGSKPVPFKFRAANLSTPGLKVLWDIQQMRQVLKATYDMSRMCIHLETSPREHIQLEPLEVLNFRMNKKPLRGLSACGGIATDLLTMLELGMRVKTFYLIEKDERARLVVKTIYSDFPIKLVFIDDINCARGKDIGHIDTATFTPICGPWSPLVDNPLGFKHPDAAVFKQCGRLKQEPKAINPHMVSIFETNKVHHKIRSDMEEQERIAGSPFRLINAADVKSPSSRNRRFSTDNTLVQFEKSDFGVSDPNTYVDEGWRSVLSPVPCAVSAGTRTRSPIFLYDTKGGSRRFASPDEVDALQGLPRGYSDAFGKVTFSDVQTEHDASRYKLNGQCLNMFHTRILWRYVSMGFENNTVSICRILQSSIDQMEAHPDKLETYLRSLNHKEKVRYIKDRFVGFVFPELEIEMTQNIPYQTRQIPDVSAKLVKSARKAITKSAEKGHIEVKAKYDSEDWVSPMFFKMKPGRFDEDGDPNCRKLTL